MPRSSFILCTRNSSSTSVNFSVIVFSFFFSLPALFLYFSISSSADARFALLPGVATIFFRFAFAFFSDWYASW